MNDDDQGSLTDVTETAHSDDDSGSSRTVEVGEDEVPQLLDDDVDTDISLPPAELGIPVAVEPGYPPASSEMTGGNSTATTEEETSDSAKDVTVRKESGENWDDDAVTDLRADNDDEATCKYNYCLVQRSPFPLGYERSKTTFISIAVKQVASSTAVFEKCLWTFVCEKCIC